MVAGKVSGLITTIPETRVLVEKAVSEEKAREIFRALALAADELPQRIIHIDWEGKKDIYSIDEYLDIDDRIAEWAYEDGQWPSEVQYVKFEIEDPRDPNYSIFVELGPCECGKCLLEIRRTRVF